MSKWGNKLLLLHTRVHEFVWEYYRVLKHTLSEDIKVDTRVGRGDCGVYQEPLERVLEYCGLQLNTARVVIVGLPDSFLPILLPADRCGSLTEYWFRLMHKHTHTTHTLPKNE
jgi:hypothetical protein